MKCFLTISLCLVAIAGIAGGRYAYSFDQFLVPKIFSGTPADPQLKSIWCRRYRTMIREQVKGERVNFAGHYTIAIWGCGTNCVSFAIVDVANGDAFDPPFETLVTTDGTGNEFEGLVFKKNSRLLIASGCPRERDCGIRYYQWDGWKLGLLRNVAVPPKSN